MRFCFTLRVLTLAAALMGAAGCGSEEVVIPTEAQPIDNVEQTKEPQGDSKR